MNQPILLRQFCDIPFGENLKAIRLNLAGKSDESIANELKTTSTVVQKITDIFMKSARAFQKFARTVDCSCFKIFEFLYLLQIVQFDVHYVTGVLEYGCQITSPRIKSLLVFCPCAGWGLNARTGCICDCPRFLIVCRSLFPLQEIIV